MLPTKAGIPINRLVLNAAFNSGNSGGPLIRVEDGEVIGVVISKMAPMPPEIGSALAALKSQSFGLGYTHRRPDGSIAQVSEAQVVETVLEYLRSQTQLVIGHATEAGALREFLTKNGIEP
jgi:hypothetical protein